MDIGRNTFTTQEPNSATGNINQPKINTKFMTTKMTRTMKMTKMMSKNTEDPTTIKKKINLLNRTT